jgi:hypothetical protein
MKRTFFTCLLLIIFSTGLMATPLGVLFSLVSEPVAVTSASGYTKVGEATAFSVLWLVAFGDASIENASRESKIRTVQHVDRTYFNLLLGLFAMETTTVYGR